MTANSANNRYRAATFLLSVAKLSQCPDDSGIEVAFAGRSNAGKSSAINAICDHKKLARASKTPGRTQQLNVFTLNQDCRIVDLPGYGFAKVPLEIRKQWGQLVGNYLKSRRSLAGIMLMMDVRHPLKDQDCELIEWAANLNLPLHVLLTKADKLKRGPAKSALLGVQRELKWSPLASAQLFSSVDHQGVAEARQMLDHWFNFTATAQ